MAGEFIKGFDALYSESGSLVTVLQAIKADTETFAKRVFKETFAGFFATYPGLSDISWTQYTPTWNDGEACTFSSGHDWPELNSHGDESRHVTRTETREGCPSCRQKMKDAFCSRCGAPKGTYEQEVSKLPEMTKGEWDDCNAAIRAFMEGLSDDDMRMLFGEDVEVIIRQDGVTTKEYYDV